MQLLPCCLGLIKLKGEPSVLSVNNYNLGDKYVSALSAGFSDAKMLEKCLLSHNRITDKGLF